MTYELKMDTELYALHSNTQWLRAWQSRTQLSKLPMREKPIRRELASVPFMLGNIVLYTHSSIGAARGPPATLCWSQQFMTGSRSW